jgi:hypothetical protein
MFKRARETPFCDAVSQKFSKLFARDARVAGGVDPFHPFTRFKPKPVLSM